MTNSAFFDQLADTIAEAAIIIRRVNDEMAQQQAIMDDLDAENRQLAGQLSVFRTALSEVTKFYHAAWGTTDDQEPNDACTCTGCRHSRAARRLTPTDAERFINCLEDVVREADRFLCGLNETWTLEELIHYLPEAVEPLRRAIEDCANYSGNAIDPAKETAPEPNTGAENETPAEESVDLPAFQTGPFCEVCGACATYGITDSVEVYSADPWPQFRHTDAHHYCAEHGRRQFVYLLDGTVYGGEPL